MDINNLIKKAGEAGASDLHLISGLAPKYRIDGSICDLGDNILSPSETEDIARMLSGSRFAMLEKDGELDLGMDFGGIRTRLNIFRQQGSYSAAIRLLSNRIPMLEELDVPPAVLGFPGYERGIVLVTGETGSGKSTTLAAILNQINRTRDQHIITLEDPIEYMHSPERCIINQREIGKDTKTYASGLRAALREDPDIILIGEMRDQETIGIALTAAETGHLVFATLHTNSAASSVDRIVDVFPGNMQNQIRMQLSMTLKATLSQQLLPKHMKKGRALACEVMIVTPAIKNLIREGKTPQIENSIASSAMMGNITMDNALIRLAKDRVISKQTAESAAHDPDYISKQLMY